ncbi:MAG: MBL fold metallo-hydrolase, partial [Patescibacteria group bacterium]
MHISWLGQTCVKLQTKNLDQDVTILIDAYKPKTGEFPRSFSPDVVLFSDGTDNAATLSQDPFTVNSLGEVEVKNI